MPLLYMRAIRPYWTRIRVVFAPIFRERYKYIILAVEVSCAACKCHFWANVDILENGDGGRTGRGSGFGEQAQAAKSRNFLLVKT